MAIPHFKSGKLKNITMIIMRKYGLQGTELISENHDAFKTRIIISRSPRLIFKKYILHLIEEKLIKNNQCKPFSPETKTRNKV